MKFLALASGSFLYLATAAHAMPTCGGPTPLSCLVGAPAPSIGAGVPVALAAGAVLCGMMLLKLWRQS